METDSTDSGGDRLPWEHETYLTGALTMLCRNIEGKPSPIP
jgi:hypothetical protein